MAAKTRSCFRSHGCQNKVMFWQPWLREQGHVLAGATADGTSYCNTIHLICSGLCKLIRISKQPAGMVLYRGNGGMALPNGFLEPDEQVCGVCAPSREQTHCACVRRACMHACAGASTSDIHRITKLPAYTVNSPPPTHLLCHTLHDLCVSSVCEKGGLLSVLGIRN